MSNATTTAARTWSNQQNAIFAWFESPMGAQGGNLVVRARAGTGKTTTILEGINQAPDARILLAAFNKRIATELQTRLTNYNAEAKTLHSLGYGFVMRNWPKPALDNKRGARLARRALEILGMRQPDEIVTTVAKLAALGKNIMPKCENPAALCDVAEAFECLPSWEQEEDGWTVEKFAQAAVHAMELACNQDGTIDFDDMVYLPVRMNWVRPAYDLVVIDEAQDMNAAQLALAMGACKRSGRIAVVGDDRQAIYGFRGASSEALDNLKKALNAPELPLTITYRCGRKIVAEACKLVPDFEAGPDNGEGEIQECGMQKMFELATVGDFILSRKNAPLAKICLGLLARGKRAKIEGADIGKGLLALVRKQKAHTLQELEGKLDAWAKRTIERANRNGQEAQVTRTEDTHQLLVDLMDGLATLPDYVTRLETLFADDETAGPRIVCSSIHRAKGLEADRVFLCVETLYPGRSGRDRQEEFNLHYVGVTRAKKTLVEVRGVEARRE